MGVGLPRNGGHLMVSCQGSEVTNGDEDRRSFADEFKREAVSLLTSSGRPVTQVARELGIQPSMLRHWRDDRQTNGTAMRTARSPSSDGMSAEHAEIRRLEKELARTQMERDILKKAIGIFSGHRNEILLYP